MHRYQSTPEYETVPDRRKYPALLASFLDMSRPSLVLLKWQSNAFLKHAYRQTQFVGYRGEASKGEGLGRIGEC